MMLLPQPQRLSLQPGAYPVPAAPATGPGELPPWVQASQASLPQGPEAYELEVTPSAVRVRFAGPAGRRHAAFTLAQMLQQHGADLPCCLIQDWPTFALRGVSLDVSRGRVPKLSTLLRWAERLAALKVNHLQLYMEHTFSFQSNPLIGQGASPLSPDDIRTLDRHCQSLGIELTPSLACFGHLSKVLSLPPYRHLAEDLGTGTYRISDPDPGKLAQIEPGWTLAPGREGAYQLLDQLLGDLLPCFSSPRFNACCDEIFDLGWGQSFDACREQGLEAVYAGHVERVMELAQRHGKTETLIYGDMLHSHPPLLALLPKELGLLDWCYDATGDFGRIRRFLEAGHSAWACPSTNSWGTLFPRLPMANANIRAFAAAASGSGAVGYLNTVWGDHGHFNQPDCEWHGLALGAEQGWNPQAESAGFTARFASVLLGIQRPGFAGAVERLGDLATLLQHGGQSSFWVHALYEAPDHAFFKRPAIAYYRGENGQVLHDEAVIDADRIAQALGSLASIRAEFEAAFAQSDRLGVGEAWRYAVDSMALAGERWLRLGPQGGGRLDEALIRRSRDLRARFEALWLDQHRPSNLQRMLDRFDASIQEPIAK